MTALTIPLPDDLADAASRLAAARRVPVERLVADLVAAAVAQAASEEAPAFVLENAEHRRIMAALERTDASVADKVSAEAYAAARVRLIALVDGSQGRMNPDGWSRALVMSR